MSASTDPGSQLPASHIRVRTSFSPCCVITNTAESMLALPQQDAWHRQLSIRTCEVVQYLPQVLFLVWLLLDTKLGYQARWREGLRNPATDVLKLHCDPSVLQTAVAVSLRGFRPVALLGAPGVERTRGMGSNSLRSPPVASSPSRTVVTAGAPFGGPVLAAPFLWPNLNI